MHALIKTWAQGNNYKETQKLVLGPRNPFSFGCGENAFPKGTIIDARVQ